MSRLRTRRGVSTFIAVLLMMILAVSAGVVIYTYTMGFLGSLGGSEALGTMSLDTASGTTSTITAWIRNVGTKSLIMDKAYVGGAKMDFGGTGNTTNPIPVGSVRKILIDGTFTSGLTYQVKLVANDNTQLAFSVKIG